MGIGLRGMATDGRFASGPSPPHTTPKPDRSTHAAPLHTPHPIPQRLFSLPAVLPLRTLRPCARGALRLEPRSFPITAPHHSPADSPTRVSPHSIPHTPYAVFPPRRFSSALSAPLRLDPTLFYLPALGLPISDPRSQIALLFPPIPNPPGRVASDALDLPSESHSSRFCDLATAFATPPMFLTPRNTCPRNATRLHPPPYPPILPSHESTAARHTGEICPHRHITGGGRHTPTRRLRDRATEKKAISTFREKLRYQPTHTPPIVFGRFGRLRRPTATLHLEFATPCALPNTAYPLSVIHSRWLEASTGVCCRIAEKSFRSSVVEWFSFKRRQPELLVRWHY
jgi:hypothetical protein